MQEIKDFEKLLSDQCFNDYDKITSFYYRSLTLYPELLDRLIITKGWFENLKNYYELNLFEE